MTAKRKGPKVKWIVDGHRYRLDALFAIHPHGADGLPSIYSTNRLDARKVAAALNLAEAVKRGEM